jgi:hypothetical protein
VDAETIGLGMWAFAIANAYEGRLKEALENAEESRRIALDPLDQLTAHGLAGVTLALMGRSQ